jgi:hypothetical protein
MYGSPALKVGGSLLTCLAINKSAEPESLAVAIDFDQRSGLLGEAPETYYVTDHYVAYPVVLVRSSQIRIDQLRDPSARRGDSSQPKRGERHRAPSKEKLNTARRKSRQP